MSASPNSPRQRSSANLLITLLILAALAVLIVDRSGIAPALSTALSVGYQWLMLLAGVALLIGAVNVVAMHLWRIADGTSATGC